MWPNNQLRVSGLSYLGPAQQDFTYEKLFVIPTLFIFFVKLLKVLGCFCLQVPVSECSGFFHLLIWERLDNKTTTATFTPTAPEAERQAGKEL